MDPKALLWKLKSPSTLINLLVPRAAPAAGQICTECGQQGAPVRQRRGREDVEVLLWIAFAVCAVLYVGSFGVHVLSHYRFPGLFVRGFSLGTKVFLVVGVLYTVWRLSSEFEACPKCGRASMIPLDTPKGRKVQQSFQ
jgi:hypothetical protein